jgi:Spy/CpxP family protein refolding chaperone
MKKFNVFAAGVIVVGFAVIAQATVARTQQPYAGLEVRAIKALSEDQIADLRAGRGMGFALAAELNGYPGPLHVLELAQLLQLSAAQQDAVKKLFDAMKAETVPLGETLIDREAALDKLFAGRKATPANVEAATTAVGAAKATLRAAHLRYHLATIEVLTEKQASNYAILRGYSGAGHSDQGHDPARHRH